MASSQFDLADLRTAPTVFATSDLTDKTGYFVWPNSSGVLVLAAADSNPVGVLTDQPVSGQDGTYLVKGRIRVVAGAAITQGAFVNVGTGGKAITSATTKPRVGVALEAAGADGDVIAIELGYLGQTP
jgi:hypothetical protein